MPSIPPSRRDVLKGTVALVAGTSLGAMTCRRARAQGSVGPARAQIDSVLRQAADGQEVPGVVAMAATDKGVLYEGAFGARTVGESPAMTLDTVFRIASMTKAITSVAAMQLVEQGKLQLTEPVPNIDPALGSPQVLERFGAEGAAWIRPARRRITLRHLLTHTAGFSYDIWHANTGRYVKAVGLPSRATGRLSSIRTPLSFDPGERWEYGVNIDWVGRLVEVVSEQTLDAYFREKIFAPLGMKDSGYFVSDEQRSRQARVHARQPDGTLTPQPWETAPVANPEFWSGGGPLYSTPRDYLTFLQMLLNGGTANGARLLKPETVALMGRNHIGSIPAGVLKTTNPALSNDVDFFPGAQMRWGLGYMLNMQPGPNGRSAGTVSWAGLFNTYYWLDPAKRVTGLIMTQILPFADPRAVKLYGQFEKGTYGALKTA
ncbi:MAG TPA: serine hydrolase domain-containing protein [Candidatus Methylomirabilis sp.]|nr:serine hydrolase domain-containing protein [Candidatus Methylomirabilis sp.]